MSKWIICDRCDGEGSHVAPGIDDNGITQSEMAELGEDFREEYFSGALDVGCDCCGGSGKRRVSEDYEEDDGPSAALERAQWAAIERWERKVGY